LQLAETAYSEALSRDPHMIGPNLQLGLLAWTRLESQLAAEHFEKALQREPFNGDALFYLAMVHLELGNLDESRRLFYRLLPSSGKFEQRDYGLGLLAIKERDYPEAQSLLESAVKQLPLQLSAHQANALILRRLGRNAEAAAACNQILVLDPTNAFALAERAFLSSWASKEVADLDRIAAHPQAYLELATEYMRLEAWAEINQVLAHAVATLQNSTEPTALLSYYRAFALAQAGKVEEARILVEQAAKQNLRVEIFPFRHETVPVLRKALSLKPDDANAAFLLGALLYSRTDRANARDLWEAGIEHDPEHFASLQHLGWTLVEEGQVDQALPFLERAAQAQPGDLGTATGIARLYARQGEMESALRVVNGALEEDPQNDQLVELQVKLTALTDDYDEALRILSTHRFGARHQSYSLLHLYQATHLLKAFQLAEEASFELALEQIRNAGDPPSSLGVDDFAALASSRLLFFEALTHALNSDAASSLDAWHRASLTVDQDFDGEGLFRAIGLFMSGEKGEAEKWFSEFEEVNRLRKKDNDTSVKILAYYLSGVYSIFRGKLAEGRQELQVAVQTDESDLLARHALLWIDGGLFRGLNQRSE
jgi:tetratricopeptide (TPR) repeat protein